MLPHPTIESCPSCSEVTFTRAFTPEAVTIEQEQTASIKQGLVVLIGFQPEDSSVNIEKMLNKLLHYRVFSDKDDKMNLSLLDIDGELLLVPQFTLAANTNSGRRPSFSSSATPALANDLFEQLKGIAKQSYPVTQFGQFGADMLVTIENDGPVTFLLQN